MSQVKEKAHTSAIISIHLLQITLSYFRIHLGCSSFADFHACRTSCATCSLPKHAATAAQVSCAVILTEPDTKSSSKSFNTVFAPFQDTSTSSASSDSSDDSYIPPKKLRAVTARKPTRACRVKKEDPVKKKLPQKDVLRCPTCFRQFKRNYDLVRHVVNAHPPVKDEPDDQKADEGSGDEESLPEDKSRELILVAPNSNEALSGPSKKSGNHVTCNNCNGKFRSKDALQRHVTGDGCMMNPTVSDTSVEVNVIGDGDSPLNTNAPLDSVPVDVQVKEEDDMPEFDMQDSDYSLSSEESDHKEEKHRAGPSKERPIFKCEICNKQFKLKESYTTHTRIHTGEKPFTCHMCGKQFSHSGGLSYHLRHVHMGIKEHPCDICGRKFALKAAMQDHRRIHTGERPYVCDVCGKSFKSKASLYIHSKTHTDQYPHPCEYCTKKFRWRQQLLGHLTTHTGEKKHHCKICNKGFGVRNDLTRHERIHSGQKPFKCSLCGLAFGQKRYLKNHLKSRHGILRMDSMDSMENSIHS